MKEYNSDSSSSPVIVADKGLKVRLYVTMQTPKSITALSLLNEVCELTINGNYHIELINLLRNPQLAQGHQILPITKLVKRLPQPFIKIIEDLYLSDSVLVGMDLVYSS